MPDKPFQNNPRLTSLEIGKAIGRSRRTLDSYIAELRAATEMELHIKILVLDFVFFVVEIFIDLFGSGLSGLGYCA